MATAVMTQNYKTEELRLVKDNFPALKTDVVSYLSELESADNKRKNEIENSLVKFGPNAVPELINQLQIVKGSIRGVVAMTLIRIGEPSVEMLKRAAQFNPEFSWIAEYLITEIECAA